MSKLMLLLDALIDSAESWRGRTRSVGLMGGLTIAATVTAGGGLTLQGSRDKALPSDQEMQTLLAHTPERFRPGAPPAELQRWKSGQTHHAAWRWQLPASGVTIEHPHPEADHGAQR